MKTTLAILGLSGGELVLVLAAILILFGAKRIPEFAKGLGKGINEFKKASREVTDEFHAIEQEPPPSAKPQRPTSESGSAGSAPPATVPKA